VPQHDPVRLADALERLVTDRALGSRLSRSARALIEDSFDVHVQAQALRRLDRTPQPTPATEVVR
jgi:glycosyltransferase involved in cell wall biosynthesis